MRKMKILITGANGQLGREIARQAAGHELILTDQDTLDITDAGMTAGFLHEHRPQAVIHCAAYTNVDGAETDEDGAFRVNVAGSRNIAAGCLENGARMVYISTDYVFDGQQQKPYREYDACHPLSVYGRTKLWGEEAVRQILGRHYILRTAWLYGSGHNFARTMLRLAEQNTPLRVVDDQVGTPTSTVDLTRAILKLLANDCYGTYHATCQGQASWYDFACEIFRQAGKKVAISPVSTAEYPRPARRPAHAVLDNYMLRLSVGDPMRPWQEALREYLEGR